MIKDRKSIVTGILTVCIMLGISTILYLFPAVPLLPPFAVQMARVLFLFTGLYLFFERLFTLKIFTRIMLGLALGIAAGILFRSSITEVRPVGTAFIRLIQMIVIPLVFASLLVGTASLGDARKMGRIGSKTLVYYLVYTVFAIILGLALAYVFRPGSGLPEEVQKQLLASYRDVTRAGIPAAGEKTDPIQTLLNLIPTNPFESLSQGVILQVIFFALFMGYALALMPGPGASSILTFFQGINDAMIRIVHTVIRMAPYGVFALIAAVVGSFGLEILFSLFKYTFVTLLGLTILNFTYPLVVYLLTGMRPATFIKGVRAPQLIAFSTSSSSATLPVTMEACEKNLGVPPQICSFVLPLGATVNMNGTALYQGVSAVFIAQVYGLPLSLEQQLMIVLTATLAAVGTAGAPGVGMLMMVIVLKQVGIPVEGISLIMGVERILDMFRTVVNITGDASAAVVIAHSESKLREPVLENDEKKEEGL